MFGRKYWIGLTVFLVVIVGISLYYLQTRPRPPKDPILIIKPVEPLPKSEVAEVVEGDTSQGGHRHADGTWHDGAQAPVVVPQAPQTETPQPQESFSPEEDARSTANLLDHLQTYIPLAEGNRDLLKRSYEDALRQLKHFEEKNAQRERNFFDTSRLKERVADIKARLDAKERDIANLKKWRDEHANK